MRGSWNGLVSTQGAGAHLTTPEGREFRLLLDEGALAVKALHGCVLQVEGPRFFRLLWVREWAVTDGGDGSIPYVGRLRQHGSNLVLDDRNSGMPLLLDAPSAEVLASHAGQLLMVVGYVVGMQELRVVEYRVLPE